MTLRLIPSDTLLIVVDIQERLVPTMIPERYGVMLKNLKLLGDALPHLGGVEGMITEQYPKGLGPTVAPVREAFPGLPSYDKLSFSIYKDDGIRAAIEASGRRTIVLVGMETHVCVYQSARDLVEAGYAVHLVSDAVCSRAASNVQVGLGLMREAGVHITGTETVLFDLLERAGSDDFKAVSKLLR